ncbi:MAG: circularly permuted type 2 ATP-grasp protein, partial [Succinivibrio sp.]|nr:circularly permuted type 2 ATP-grasp protein [Succinivibrio sp.]
METLLEGRNAVNSWLERYGVKFGIYKNGVFKEQLFPYDSIPRVISKDDWEILEKGLVQRATALNRFIYDV